MARKSGKPTAPKRKPTKARSQAASKNQAELLRKKRSAAAKRGWATRRKKAAEAERKAKREKVASQRALEKLKRKERALQKRREKQLDQRRPLLNQRDLREVSEERFAKFLEKDAKSAKGTLAAYRKEIRAELADASFHQLLRELPDEHRAALKYLERDQLFKAVIAYKGEVFKIWQKRNREDKQKAIEVLRRKLEKSPYGYELQLAQQLDSLVYRYLTEHEFEEYESIPQIVRRRLRAAEDLPEFDAIADQCALEFDMDIREIYRMYHSPKAEDFL